MDLEHNFNAQNISDDSEDLFNWHYLQELKYSVISDMYFLSLDKKSMHWEMSTMKH